VQFAALFLLRNVKNEGVDDSQYLHSLTYVDLDVETFRDITEQDRLRLEHITAALGKVDKQRSVPEPMMRRALTVAQFDEYVASFDTDISHIECDESDDMPWQLRNYMEQIRNGDRYTRIANLFQRAKKKDFQGKTAYNRYNDKAFGCYEAAVMDLCNWLELDPKRNPLPNSNTAYEIQRWLDRDVSTKDGEGPDISPQGVPRIRGSKSKYTQLDAEPTVGTRLRRHWRQREALSKAALELLYAEPEDDSAKGKLVSEKLREILARRDEDEVE
jgi:hypothetical protein